MNDYILRRGRGTIDEIAASALFLCLHISTCTDGAAITIGGPSWLFFLGSQCADRKMPNLDARPEIFVRGFKAPEGPSFTEDGHLVFADYEAGRIYRIAPNREVEVFAETGGRPTGTKFHRDGRLLVCDSVRGLITVDPDGDITVLASECDGRSLTGPNDLTINLQGDVYFTDPGESSLENPTGNVYLYRSDGSLQLFDSGYACPNGVAVGPHGKTLYMAETHTRVVYCFTLGERGRWMKRNLFTVLEGGIGPDGMAFDAEGNLYVAHWDKGCVGVLAPDGTLLGELPTIGMQPTNVAFWNDVLYVTEVEKGQVVRLEIGVHGLQVYGLGEAAE